MEVGYGVVGGPVKFMCKQELETEGPIHMTEMAGILIETLPNLSCSLMAKLHSEKN